MREWPTTGPTVVDCGPFTLRSVPLRHRVETLGWRIDEPDGRRMLPARLEELGVVGPDIGRLQREGSIEVGGRSIALEDVSEVRRGQSAAVVMDTAWCEGALELAAGVDLLVCESTFLDRDADLAERGVAGPAIGRLQREGTIEVDGRVVRLDEVSAPRPGQSVAVVMDTAWCDGAVELADGVDLLVCEATFLDRDANLAERYLHMTARQAGRLAADTGARRLVLTHFSRRYDDPAEFAAEAGELFAGDVVVAADLDRIAVPPRR